jgi:hypothetical protein
MAAEEGSERELEEFLAGTGVLSAGTEPPPVPTGDEEVVHDERPGVEPPVEDETPTPPPSPSPDSVQETPGEEKPEEEEQEQGEPHVVWATKKYGTDPTRWAKAAYDQERFISQLAADKKQAEETAAQAIEYARQVESSTSSHTGMPMSSAEEQWVEEAMSNPTGYAYQAARNGNVQLFHAVIGRLAEENPGMAANVSAQVQMQIQQEINEAKAQRAAAQNGAQGVDFNTEMGMSFQRLGIDVSRYGQPMWEKIEELGEYHPYALAILGGDPIQRDLALSAVYDLVRAGQTTTRRVADTEREEQIRREGELRRNAAGVVTGAPHTPPAKQSPCFDAMEEEWRRRGQWHDEGE